MKTLRSTLILSLLIVSAIGCAQPQGGNKGGQRGGQPGQPPTPSEDQIEEMVSNLADEISLSTEQEASILELYTDHFDQVKEKTSGNSRPAREEMEALKSSFEKQVKAQLSDDQLTKYEAYLKKQQNRPPPRK